MNDIEPRRTYLPSKRVVKLAGAVLVLNSIGVWAVVSLKDIPNIEVQVSLKMNQRAPATMSTTPVTMLETPAVIKAPAAPTGLTVR